MRSFYFGNTFQNASSFGFNLFFMGKSLFCEGSPKKPIDGILRGIIKDLENEEWDVEDRPCLSATVDMLNGVRNSKLWATWIWDSMQLPTGVFYGSKFQLGGFDQCINPPWLKTQPNLRTQYCLADIPLADGTPENINKAFEPNDDVVLYLHTKSKFGRYFNNMIWGVCMSDKCTKQAISKYLEIILKYQHIPRNSTSGILVHSCQVAETTAYGFGVTLFLLIISFPIIMVLLSMAFLTHEKPETFATRLLICFSLKRNWISLTRTDRDQIQVLNGMRLLSSIIVVMTHYVVIRIYISVINGLDILELGPDSILESLLLHLDLVVDTFFLMSGLLLVKSIIRHQEHGKGSLVKLLWSRYVRFLGPQALVVFYYAKVSRYVGSGPLWPLFAGFEADNCANNWWTNLFMINNYVRVSKKCQLESWYNASDYQMSILFTFLYFVYQKKRHFGLKCFALAFFTSLILPGLFTYLYQLPAILFYDMEKIGNMRANMVYLSSYTQAHHRACVYIIGMVLGHFITIFKPADYRKIISLKYSIVGTFIALLAMERTLSLGVKMVFNDYHPLEKAVFVSTNRSIWALAICGIIVLCEYGTVPLVGDFLKLKFAITIGRLSYGVYMVHLAIIYCMAFSTRAPVSYNFLPMVIEGLGVAVFAYFLSFVMWFLVEAPLVNISNFLLEYFSQNKPKAS